LYPLLIDDSRDNNDDFMPSGPWDDDNLCNDHVDEGAGSDVEEPVNLIAKPRQVHPSSMLLKHSFLYTYIGMYFCLLSFYVHLKKVQLIWLYTTLLPS
jgi:hypothetical protein